jgi:ATP-dependent Clp protease adapter protein ClpS
MVTVGKMPNMRGCANLLLTVQ